MKKKIFLLPILALLLAGCGQPQPTSIEITGAKTVEVDSSIDLTAKVLPAKANQEVSWVSSAPEIAVVSAAGKVTGKAEGTAKITVTSKAKTDVSNFVDITVTAKPVVETPVESVAITTPNGTSVEEGATLVLGKTVLPANANQNVTWESSDKTVATVNNGMVVGVKAGTAEISIASVADVTKTAKVAITVTEKAVVELVVSSFLGADNVGRDAAGLKGHVAYKAENSVFLQDATGILQVFTGYDAGAKEVAVGDYIEVTTGVSQLRYGSTRLAKTEASGGTGAGDAAEIKKIEGGTAPVALTPENMSAVEARAYADAAKTGYVGNKLVKMTDEIEVYLNGKYKNLRFVGETGPYVIASQGTLTAFKPDLETVGNVLEDVVLVLTGANNSSRIDTMVVSYKVKGVDPDVKHTVTFDSDGGSEVAPVEVNDGAKVAKPADPTKDGVSFVEWQLNGVAYDFEAPVTGPITLKAVWEVAGEVADEATVILSYGGGTSNMVEGNNAALVGLNPELFDVVSEKGEATNHVGVATNEIRIYSVRASGNGNTLSVSIGNSKKITKIVINFTSTVAQAEIKIDGEGVYNETPAASSSLPFANLSASNFSIKNVHTGGSKNAQLRIASIEITYADADGFGADIDDWEDVEGGEIVLQ